MIYSIIGLLNVIGVSWQGKVVRKWKLLFTSEGDELMCKQWYKRLDYTNTRVREC